MKKKIMAVTCALAALYAPCALPAFAPESCAPALVSVAKAAASVDTADEASPSWLPDIDEATIDDTMAFGVYIGKPLQTYMDDFKRKGWKINNSYSTAIAFQKDKGDYLIAVAVYPHENNKNLAGNYSVRFHVKDRNTADEMYMRAEKNFSYNFGRPSIKRGTNNRTWFISDTFSLLVEYNEYDARMPLVQKFPFEIVVKRQTGDFKRFFQARQ